VSLWSDIKQRRITQIFLSYLVGGWIILQVVDQVVDRDVLPRYAYLVALILFGFGIPAALIIGWYHGEKGTQKATSLEVALLSLLTVGAVGSSVIVVQNELRIETARSGQIALTRMAVLYFEGTDEETSLVGDGLTEDLIERLSLVPDLDVVSRNGSRSVRQAGMPLEEAAEYLDVGSVLAGDVRQSGDDFVVSVQLRTRDDIRLANITARGPTDDVVALQEEVASQVEDQIRSAVGEEIRLRQTRSEAPNNGAWLAVARGERALERAVAGDPGTAEPDFDEAEAAFREAASLAEDWAEPWNRLAETAHERGVDWAREPAVMDSLFQETVALAGQALDRDPTSREAVLWRGKALYDRYRRNFIDAPAEAEAALEQARSDLERAAETYGSADAYSVLSHLYYQDKDLTGAALAARQAYRADAFLRASRSVLRRLVVTNYDLGDVEQSREWCGEGYRRFPDDYYFTECRLWLMTMPGVDPDVDYAWALRDSVQVLLGSRWEGLEATETLIVAGVIARAGLSDSASAVMDRFPGEPSTEAAMRLLNGQEEQAIQLLMDYTAGTAGHFGEGSRLMWWWEPLRGDPDFERLRRLN
jgi:TolB-like protein